MLKRIFLGLSLLHIFKGVVSIENKNSAEQNETIIQEIVVRTKSAGSSGMGKELEALMWKMNAKLDAMTAKMDVQLKSQDNSTTLNKTADGGNDSKQVGDKVVPSVAPDDDRKQVDGKKFKCEFNITQIMTPYENRNFHAAKRYCDIRWEGFLAMPKTVGDLYQLHSRRSRWGNVAHGKYWVGAKRKNNTWFWLSGEHIPKSFIGWYPGEPTTDGDCLIYFMDLKVSGLRAQPCDGKRGRFVKYFCQSC